MQYLLRLRRSVGDSQQNRPDDVLRVKTALNQLGYYDVGIHGLAPDANEGLLSAIRGYQQQRGLKVDGQMRPSGPTETDIESALQGSGSETAVRSPIYRCIKCGAPHGGARYPFCPSCWEKLLS